MSQAVSQKTEITETFQFHPNPKFNILPSSGVTQLPNSAVSVSYPRVSHATNGGTNMSFQRVIGEKLFLDRGVVIETAIPVKLTKTGTAWGTAPSATNYVGTATNFLRDVAFRQHALMSVIENMELKFNEGTVANISNVWKAVEETCDYWKESSIDEFCLASIPDRHSKYSNYKSDVNVINTVDSENKKIMLEKSVISDEDIFLGGRSDRYNTRKVVFEYKSATTTTLTLICHIWTFIPFTTFGLPTSPFSIYGVNNFQFDCNLVANYVKHLFVIRDSAVWDKVEFDEAYASLNKSAIQLITYRAPSYVENAMIDPVSGTPKPWRIGYTDMNFQPVSAITPSPQTPDSVDTPQITLGVIPKSIYLSIHAVRDTTKPWLTPNFKARINSIVATIGSAETTIGPSAITIFNLAKSNGLGRDYEAAMFTNGAVIKLDVSKDLSMGGSIVGSNTPVTMHFKIGYTTLDDTHVNYEVRVLTAFAAQLTYRDREFRVVRSLVLSSTAFDIQNQAEEYYKNTIPHAMTIGAGFFGDVWSGVKKLASKGFNWIKEHPDEALGLVRKGIKLATGAGNVPYTQNIIGGSDTLLLGAGKTQQNVFKN
jgi:hypothetical protein